MNALQILSELIQTVSDVANTCSSHTHPGVAVLTQAATFTEQKCLPMGLNPR